MEFEFITNEFHKLIAEDVAIPVCAMNCLVSVIRKSSANTWMQLEQELRQTISHLKTLSFDKAQLKGKTAISLTSGCDLFMKYVTRAFLEFYDFNSCKVELLKRGERFAGMSLASRSKIASIGQSFVQDGSTVLVHGNSRVVNALLLKAAETKHFNVIVTEGRPLCDGYDAARTFSLSGISTTLVCDTYVGSIMDRVSVVLVGAEGVMENGGIVNKVGTYQVAICARVANKPFYVAVESYKFARMFPLSQRDIKAMCGAVMDAGDTTYLVQPQGESLPKNVEMAGSSIDFTPAEYITLLLTDLGVLTPAAVSDELIRLYH